MEFKIKRLIIAWFVLQISQFVFSENPQILKSSENPIHGNLNLRLKRDLTLGEEAPGPYLFASVDAIEASDKYIYVLDARMAKVRVYDLKGKFIRDIGRKGQGPGEFMLPTRLCLSANEDIYVYDMMTGRMTVFSGEGSYIRDFHLIEGIEPRKFYVNKDNYIYMTFNKFDPEKLVRNINFGKLDPKGEPIKIFFEIFNHRLIPFREKGSAGNLFYEHPYLNYLYLAIIPDDNFAMMESMKYEIKLVSKEGGILLKILREEKESKVTKKEKEIALSKERTGIPKELKKYATFSEIRPYCSNLLSDEKGRIYVERFKPVTEKGGPYIYEIFNKKGEYLYRLTLGFKIELIRDGYVYSISTDEERGQIKIVRYKIENWNEIKF